MGVARASFDVVYQGKDITNDLQGEVMSITYRDKTEGEADELTLVVKDEGHKWKNAWNPAKGDVITASISTAPIDVNGDSTAVGKLDCGSFTVNEIEFSGDGSEGHRGVIHALSAGNVDPVRTKSSFAHEGKTLKAIADYYANKHHYKVQGIIHNFSITRVTQFHESDLGFLHRVAEEFGYVFTLRGDTLVFTYLPELNASMEAGITILFDSVMSYSIRDKTAGVYVRGQNRYHNPKTKNLYDSLVDAGANPLVNTGQDIHRTHEHVDNDEQGLYKADGRLYKKNLSQVEINCDLPGNVSLVAGVNVQMSGWGVYDGVYFLESSAHEVTGQVNYKTGGVFKKLVKNQDVGNKKGTKVGY